jgi:hypothetical protein
VVMLYLAAGNIRKARTLARACAGPPLTPPPQTSMFPRDPKRLTP